MPEMQGSKTQATPVPTYKLIDLIDACVLSIFCVLAVIILTTPGVFGHFHRVDMNVRVLMIIASIPTAMSGAIKAWKLWGAKDSTQDRSLILNSVRAGAGIAFLALCIWA